MLCIRRHHESSPCPVSTTCVQFITVPSHILDQYGGMGIDVKAVLEGSVMCDGYLLDGRTIQLALIRSNCRAGLRGYVGC